MKFSEGNKSSNKMDYLKMKAGESVRGTFRGDPHTFKMHWLNDQKKSQLCSGSGCPLCSAGDKPKFRFRLNFIMNENGAFVAKVFEQGWTVYETLKALHEGDYNLEQHVMKISRHGSGTDTSYSIVPVPNGQLSKEQESQVAKVQLHTLTNETPTEKGDEIPF